MVAKFWIPIIIATGLTGCTMTKMEHVYIDNTATNNFVGNPCSFYLRFQGGSAQCFAMKPTPTNKDNPYKNDK